MAVDEMTLLALFLSGERIADVNYGHHNGSHISMPSPYSQAPPNFIPPTASAQVYHTPSFNRNSGAHPEGYGAYFSSTIVQSPYSFDSGPLLDTRVSMPGPQEDLAERELALSYAQAPPNIPPRRRRRNQHQKSLPKDANGYVVIEAAWERLLKGPVLRTGDFGLFFPPDQTAEPLGNDARRCRVRASVTKSGRPEWLPNPFDEPCGHELESVDSYRRHIINQHLGCPRGTSSKQEDWIGKRWRDAMRSNTL